MDFRVIHTNSENYLQYLMHIHVIKFINFSPITETGTLYSINADLPARGIKLSLYNEHHETLKNTFAITEIRNKDI